MANEMKHRPEPTFGDTLNGRTFIEVHGEEMRLVSARYAYAAPDLVAALRKIRSGEGYEGFGDAASRLVWADEVARAALDTAGVKG